MLEDTHKQQGLRKKLIEGIAKKGIENKDILDAMLRVPRHSFFFEPEFLHRAYDDTAFPIGEGQTISQPYTVAYQTQLLEIKRSDKVLEIGTGSGYQAAVLAEMGARVFTIERQKKLFDRTRALYEEMMHFRPALIRVKLHYGDGYEGWPTFAPFDKVLVTAGANEIPQKLIGQIRNGGIMVIPVGSDKMQQMVRITKISKDELKQEVFDSFKFVPLLKGKVNGDS
jgi:protein-L-isoaspartate(D-aspartate) O-methyltransferase